MEKGALSKALQYVKLLKDGSFAGTFFRVSPFKKIPITFREMTFMDKILLHSCCAPCSVYCVDTLRGEGIEIFKRDFPLTPEEIHARTGTHAGSRQRLAFTRIGGKLWTIRLAADAPETGREG